MIVRSDKILFLVLNLLVAALAAEHWEPWCHLSCKKAHTVCDREGCMPDVVCGQVYVQMNDDLRLQLLNEHNKFRNIIALGLDSRRGNSAASNMQALSYSKELEFVAQCWANACEYANDMCRITPNFPNVGQNVYEKYGKSMYNDHRYYLLAVRFWFDQIENINRSLIDSYHNEYEVYYKEFSQMMWAKTTHVGCGALANSKLKKMNLIIVVCNYSPAGNIFREPMYKRGRPASECPPGFPANASKFQGLCGKITYPQEDTYKFPWSLDAPRLENSLLNTTVMCLFAFVLK